MCEQSQLSQIVEWCISNAPTTKLFSDIRYLYYKNKLKYIGGKFWSASGFKIRNPENVSIGKNCSFEENVYIIGAAGVTIGSNCKFSTNVFVGSAGDGGNGKEDSYITIGNDCSFNANVRIMAGVHDWSKKIVGGLLKADVNIGNNVQILANSTILPKVNIGNNVFIGAGSIVTRDVPDNKVAFGVPCKIRGERI